MPNTSAVVGRSLTIFVEMEDYFSNDIGYF